MQRWCLGDGQSAALSCWVHLGLVCAQGTVGTTAIAITMHIRSVPEVCRMLTKGGVRNRNSVWKHLPPVRLVLTEPNEIYAAALPPSVRRWPNRDVTDAASPGGPASSDPPPRVQSWFAGKSVPGSRPSKGLGGHVGFIADIGWSV